MIYDNSFDQDKFIKSSISRTRSSSISFFSYSLGEISDSITIVSAVENVEGFSFSTSFGYVYSNSMFLTFFSMIGSHSSLVSYPYL